MKLQESVLKLPEMSVGNQRGSRVKNATTGRIRIQSSSNETGNSAAVRKDVVNLSRDVREKIQAERPNTDNQTDSTQASIKSDSSEALQKTESEHRVDKQNRREASAHSLKLLLEHQTGKDVEIAGKTAQTKDSTGSETSGDDASSSSESGSGVSVQGAIETTDGYRLQFDANLDISGRHIKVEEFDIESKDLETLSQPLVLNFDGTASELIPSKTEDEFDPDDLKDRESIVESGREFVAGRSDENDDEGSDKLKFETLDELSDVDADSDGWIDRHDIDNMRESSSSRSSQESQEYNEIGDLSESTASQRPDAGNSEDITSE